MKTLNQFSSMLLYKEKAFAKINLSLTILNKRTDGYHNIKSYVIFADIYDTISLKLLNTTNKKIHIEITGPFAKKLKTIGSDNLCYKAALYFINKYKITNDMVVKINKKLPVASGIGGGSADAAATLKLLAKIYNIKLSKIINDCSFEISRELGADVPACMYSKKLIMHNIGDKILNLSGNFKKILNSYKWLILITPNKEISTEKVFNNYNLISNNQTRDLKSLNYFFKNDLKPYVEKIEPSIRDIQKLLTEQKGLIYCGMSGSGPTCFGIFNNKNSVINAKNKIKILRPKWWIYWSSII